MKKVWISTLGPGLVLTWITNLMFALKAARVMMAVCNNCAKYENHWPKNEKRSSRHELQCGYQVLVTFFDLLPNGISVIYTSQATYYEHKLKK